MKKFIALALLLTFGALPAFAADTKVTALTENTAPAAADLLYIVDDPGGSPLSQKVTLANLALNMPDIIVLGNDLSVGAAGVKFTGSNGSVTLLGLGDGTDEDLKIDLNAANVVTLTSTTGVDNIVGLNSYSLGAAGVKLTGDGDGALTILGLGNGYNEDLTINLDDTENTAVISSSTGVTSISTGAIGITSTGTVTQAASVLTPTAIASLGTATAGKLVMTSDSGANNDCTTSGGTGKNLCIGDGSAFVFIKSVVAP